MCSIQNLIEVGIVGLDIKHEQRIGNSRLQKPCSYLAPAREKLGKESTVSRVDRPCECETEVLHCKSLLFNIFFSATLARICSLAFFS